MTTTHAALGLIVAIGVTSVDPRFGAEIAIAAYAGSVLPDLDILVGEHRRSLHYPVGYWVLTLPATGIAVYAPSVGTVGTAVFLGCAGLHAVSDILGGGLGAKPWIEDDERGVYDHVHKRWILPLRVIRWDGAPEDLLLAVLCSIPPLLVFDRRIQVLTLFGVVASVCYTVLRKRLPDLVPWLFT